MNLCIIKFNKGTLVNTLLGHGNAICGVASVPQLAEGNVFCSASVDGTIKIWQPPLVDESEEKLEKHNFIVTAVACSPNKQFVLSADR